MIITPRFQESGSRSGPRGLPPTGPFRVRLDRVDNGGKTTLRRAGTLHHLNVGYAHRGKPLLILIDPTTVTITDRNTGEVLSEHHIQPDKKYWPNNTKEPGRWPGSQR